jgi:hypothetical protein
MAERNALIQKPQDMGQDRMSLATSSPAHLADVIPQAGEAPEDTVVTGQGMSPAEGPSAASVPAPLHIDVADELAKLAGLRDRRVITYAEFEGQKKRILEG